MNRSFGKSVNNRDFNETTIEAVWCKARIIQGVDPRIRRLDACGAVIDRNQYGKCDRHGTGWEVDHIHPVARGGTDTFDNLQPLQWENNRHKGDDLRWSCAVVKAA
jgi:hypothetical protein